MRAFRVDVALRRGKKMNDTYSKNYFSFVKSFKNFKQFKPKQGEIYVFAKNYSTLKRNRRKLLFWQYWYQWILSPWFHGLNTPDDRYTMNWHDDNDKSIQTIYKGQCSEI